MRIKSITFSRWGSSDQDFSGIRLTNKSGQSSELMGTKRHDEETAEIKELPIARIQIFEKNDAYMRGFRIHYRNGDTTLINSDTGIDKGAIEFEETDILVGLTCLCTAPNDLKPRGFGFTVMRRQNGNYVYHQTKILGNSISNYTETWPPISTLQNRQDVA